MLKNIRLSTFILIAIIVGSSCQNSEIHDSPANPPGNVFLPDPNRLSSIEFNFEGDVRGCGDSRAFRFTKDGTKALTVNVNKEQLKIMEKPSTFDIETTKGLDVFIEDFGDDTYENRIEYCYDAVYIRNVEPTRFIAKAGKATMYTSKSSRPYGYKVTVTLENVRFSNDQKGVEFAIPKVDIRDVEGGSSPG